MPKLPNFDKMQGRLTPFGDRSLNFKEAPEEQATETESNVKWHMVFAEGQKIYHPWYDGEFFEMTAESLASLEKNHNTYTNNDTYKLAALKEHGSFFDTEGRAGSVLQAKNVPGKGYFTQIQWNEDTMAEINAGKYPYLSPSIAFDYMDHTGQRFSELVLEVSCCGQPWLKNLPSIEEGQQSLEMSQGAFDHWRLKEQKMADEKKVTKDEGEEIENHDGDETQEDIDALNTRISELEAENADLRSQLEDDDEDEDAGGDGEENSDDGQQDADMSEKNKGFNLSEHPEFIKLQEFKAASELREMKSEVKGLIQFADKGKVCSKIDPKDFDTWLELRQSNPALFIKMSETQQVRVLGDSSKWNTELKNVELSEAEKDTAGGVKLHELVAGGMSISDAFKKVTTN